MIRPENKALEENQKQRVLKKVRERSLTCGSCSSNHFEVGDTLYLGFLFLDEDNDMYMIALTCERSDCDAPRAGIKLREAEFLKEETKDD